MQALYLYRRTHLSIKSSCVLVGERFKYPIFPHSFQSKKCKARQTIVHTMSSVNVRSDLKWNGLGANEIYTETFDRCTTVERLNPLWVRVPLQIPDPGINGMSLNSAQMDALWEPYVARITYSGLVNFTQDRVIYFGNVPRSWLSLARELRGEGLLAYANLLASAVITFQKAKVNVTWLELCEEPDKAASTKMAAPLTPDNYVMLVRAFKAAISRRNVTFVKLIGPCLSRLIGSNDYAEPYVAAFAGKASLLDAWSIHVTESATDHCRFNASNHTARTYVFREMTRTIQFMKWVNSEIPIFATKLGTIATKYSTGIDYGKGAPEGVEHALRIVESLCSVANAGVSVVLPWTTAESSYMAHSMAQTNACCLGQSNLRDNRCLVRRDGSRRPHCEALGLVNATLPFGGLVYRRVENPSQDDETIVMTVVKGNSFGFILGRAHRTDRMQGRYDYSLKNADWIVTSEPGVSYEATIQMKTFPSYISLTGTDRIVALTSDGSLHLSLKEVPYNCIIFGRGDVYRL